MWGTLEVNRKLISSVCIVFSILPTNGFANEVKYRCADGSRLTAQFASPGDGLGMVFLVFASSGDAYSLPLAPSGDGSRYSDGSTEFWITGKSAKLTRDQSSTTCETE